MNDKYYFIAGYFSWHEIGWCFGELIRKFHYDIEMSGHSSIINRVNKFFSTTIHYSYPVV